MTAAFLSWHRRMWHQRLNGTLSAVLADGRTPSISLAGLEISLSGPARARVSRSPRPAAEPAPTMSDTYGPSGSSSSKSADLQSFLANKCRRQVDSNGSMLFKLTFKERATPSGFRICAVRGSRRPTSDSACTSWPSPTVNDSKGSDYTYANGDHNRICLKLRGAAKLAHWSSPITSNANGSRKYDGKRGIGLNSEAKLAPWPTVCVADSGRASGTFARGNPTLVGAAKMAHWPTPNASGAERGGSVEHMDGRRSNLIDTVMLASWATPAAQEAGGTPEQFLARKEKANENGSSLGVSLTSLSLQAQLASGTTPNGSTAPTASIGQLNPEHPRWLQGYPAEWGSFADTATRSRSK